jgi:hemerythrin
MPDTEWNEDMSVGIGVLDEDHRKVFEMINELQEAIKAGHKRDVLEAVLDRLMEYTLTHLAREEEMLAQAGYRGLIEHQAQHSRMIQRIKDMRSRFTEGSVAMLSLELRNFLQEWWILHIQGTDKKYGLFLNSHGIF